MGRFTWLARPRWRRACEAEKAKGAREVEPTAESDAVPQGNRVFAEPMTLSAVSGSACRSMSAAGTLATRIACTCWCLDIPASRAASDLLVWAPTPATCWLAAGSICFNNSPHRRMGRSRMRVDCRIIWPGLITSRPFPPNSARRLAPMSAPRTTGPFLASRSAGGAGRWERRARGVRLCGGPERRKRLAGKKTGLAGPEATSEYGR